MITQQIRSDFQRFLYHGPAIMTGRQAEMALRDAKTLKAWREEQLQPRVNDDNDWDLGTVRLVMEPEVENYFNVYGEPDSEREKRELIETLNSKGCYWVASEFWNPDSQEWEVADSIGMCVYDDPLDPFENCYIVQLMQTAIDKVRLR